MKVILEDLGVEELPESAAFLAPFCNGPERRWEDHDYQLTDLKSVKEEKMNLRNFDCAARRNDLHLCDDPQRDPQKLRPQL